MDIKASSIASGVDRIISASGSDDMVEDRLWSIRRHYLPHGTTNSLSERYSDVQCLSYLLDYLHSHTESGAYQDRSAPPQPNARATAPAVALSAPAARSGIITAPTPKLPHTTTGAAASTSRSAAAAASGVTFSFAPPVVVVASNGAAAAADWDEFDTEHDRYRQRIADRMPDLFWDLRETVLRCDDSATESVCERMAALSVKLLRHPEPVIRAFVLHYILTDSAVTDVFVGRVSTETRSGLVAPLFDLVSGDELTANRTAGWIALHTLITHFIDLSHSESIIVFMYRAALLRVRRYAAATNIPRPPAASALTIQYLSKTTSDGSDDKENAAMFDFITHLLTLTAPVPDSQSGPNAGAGAPGGDESTDISTADDTNSTAVAVAASPRQRRASMLAGRPSLIGLKRLDIDSGGGDELSDRPISILTDDSGGSGGGRHAVFDRLHASLDSLLFLTLEFLKKPNSVPIQHSLLRLVLNHMISLRIGIDSLPILMLYTYSNDAIVRQLATEIVELLRAGDEKAKAELKRSLLLGTDESLMLPPTPVAGSNTGKSSAAPQSVIDPATGLLVPAPAAAIGADGKVPQPPKSSADAERDWERDKTARDQKLSDEINRVRRRLAHRLRSVLRIPGEYARLDRVTGPAATAGSTGASSSTLRFESKICMMPHTDKIKATLRAPAVVSTVAGTAAGSSLAPTHRSRGSSASSLSSSAWNPAAAMPNISYLIVSLIAPSLPGVPEFATTVPVPAPPTGAAGAWLAMTNDDPTLEKRARRQRKPSTASSGDSKALTVAGDDSAADDDDAEAEETDEHAQRRLAREYGVPFGFVLSHAELSDDIPITATLEPPNSQTALAAGAPNVPTGFRTRPLTHRYAVGSLPVRVIDLKPIIATPLPPSTRATSPQLISTTEADAAWSQRALTLVPLPVLNRATAPPRDGSDSKFADRKQLIAVPASGSGGSSLSIDSLRSPRSSNNSSGRNDLQKLHDERKRLQLQKANERRTLQREREVRLKNRQATMAKYAAKQTEYAECLNLVSTIHATIDASHTSAQQTDGKNELFVWLDRLTSVTALGTAPAAFTESGVPATPSAALSSGGMESITLASSPAAGWPISEQIRDALPGLRTAALNADYSRALAVCVVLSRAIADSKHKYAEYAEQQRRSHATLIGMVSFMTKLIEHTHNTLRPVAPLSLLNQIAPPVPVAASLIASSSAAAATASANAPLTGTAAGAAAASSVTTVSSAAFIPDLLAPTPKASNDGGPPVSMPHTTPPVLSYFGSRRSSLSGTVTPSASGSGVRSVTSDSDSTVSVLYPILSQYIERLRVVFPTEDVVESISLVSSFRNLLDRAITIGYRSWVTSQVDLWRQLDTAHEQLYQFEERIVRDGITTDGVAIFDSLIQTVVAGLPRNRRTKLRALAAQRVAASAAATAAAAVTSSTSAAAGTSDTAATLATALTLALKAETAVASPKFGSASGGRSGDSDGGMTGTSAGGSDDLIDDDEAEEESPSARLARSWPIELSRPFESLYDALRSVALKPPTTAAAADSGRDATVMAIHSFRAVLDRVLTNQQYLLLVMAQHLLPQSASAAPIGTTAVVPATPASLSSAGDTKSSAPTPSGAAGAPSLSLSVDTSASASSSSLSASSSTSSIRAAVQSLSLPSASSENHSINERSWLRTYEHARACCDDMLSLLRITNRSNETMTPLSLLSLITRALLQYQRRSSTPLVHGAVHHLLLDIQTSCQHSKINEALNSIQLLITNLQYFGRLNYSSNTNPAGTGASTSDSSATASSSGGEDDRLQVWSSGHDELIRIIGHAKARLDTLHAVAGLIRTSVEPSVRILVERVKNGPLVSEYPLVKQVADGLHGTSGAASSGGAGGGGDIRSLLDAINTVRHSLTQSAQAHEHELEEWQTKLHSDEAQQREDEERRRARASHSVAFGGSGGDTRLGTPEGGDTGDEHGAGGAPRQWSSTDFHVYSRIRIEMVSGDERDDATGKPIPIDSIHTAVFEAVVVDKKRAVLATPMTVEDDSGSAPPRAASDQLIRSSSGAGGNGLPVITPAVRGAPAVGSTFLMQVSDRFDPQRAVYDLTLEVTRVISDEQFVQSVLESAAALRRLRAKQELESRFRLQQAAFQQSVINKAAGRPGSASANVAAGGGNTSAIFSVLNQSKRPLPVAAGITSEGTPLYYPAVTLAPAPVGYTTGGKPIYALPQAPKPLPLAYTKTGLPFFPLRRITEGVEPTAADEKRDSSERIVGYTRDGVPFLASKGSRLPVPSGYTPSGIPYYHAAALLDFMDNKLTSAEEEETAEVASVQKLIAAEQQRKAEDASAPSDRRKSLIASGGSAGGGDGAAGSGKPGDAAGAVKRGLKARARQPPPAVLDVKQQRAGGGGAKNWPYHRLTKIGEGTDEDGVAGAGEGGAIDPLQPNKKATGKGSAPKLLFGPADNQLIVESSEDGTDDTETRTKKAIERTRRRMANRAAANELKEKYVSSGQPIPSHVRAIIDADSDAEDGDEQSAAPVQSRSSDELKIADDAPPSDALSLVTAGGSGGSGKRETSVTSPVGSDPPLHVMLSARELQFVSANNQRRAGSSGGGSELQTAELTVTVTQPMSYGLDRERRRARRTGAPLTPAMIAPPPQKLIFRFTAQPDLLFTITPSVIELPDELKASGTVSVRFDSSRCTPSSLVQGLLAVHVLPYPFPGSETLTAMQHDLSGLMSLQSPRAGLAMAVPSTILPTPQHWSNHATSIGADCSLAALCGPFIRVVMQSDSADCWCAVGHRVTLSFVIHNLIKTQVPVEIEFVQKQSHRTFSTPEEQFTVEPLANRQISVVFAPTSKGRFDCLIQFHAVGMQTVEVHVHGVCGIPLDFTLVDDQHSTAAAAGRKPPPAALFTEAGEQKTVQLVRAPSDGADSDDDFDADAEAEAEAKAAAEQVSSDSETEDAATRQRKQAERMEQWAEEDLGLTDEQKTAKMAERAAAATAKRQAKSERRAARKLANEAKWTAERERRMQRRKTRDLTRQPSAAPTIERTLTIEEAAHAAEADRDARMRRRVHQLKVRPQSGPVRMHERGGGGKRSNKALCVDFGLVDAIPALVAPVPGGDPVPVPPAPPTYTRTIQMHNLTPYRVVIIVVCHSKYFRCGQRFYEIPRKGTSNVRVTFSPEPGMDGLVTGQLEVFWQDASNTVFNVQAFVGQPIQFNLSPRAFFVPTSIGQESSFTALAFNRSPYPIHWSLTPFGGSQSSSRSLALRSFRILTRSSSSQAQRSDDLDGTAGEDSRPQSSVKSKRDFTRFAGTGTGSIRDSKSPPGGDVLGDSKGPAPRTVVSRGKVDTPNATGPQRRRQPKPPMIVTDPYSNSSITLVFEACVRGIVAGTLGIRVYRPSFVAYPATPTHAVTLIGIGLQPSYALTNTTSTAAPITVVGSALSPNTAGLTITAPPISRANRTLVIARRAVAAAAAAAASAATGDTKEDVKRASSPTKTPETGSSVMGDTKSDAAAPAAAAASGLSITITAPTAVAPPTGTTAAAPTATTELNTEWGGTDLRDDLAQLQRWLSTQTSERYSSLSGAPLSTSDEDAQWVELDWRTLIGEPESERGSSRGAAGAGVVTVNEPSELFAILAAAQRKRQAASDQLRFRSYPDRAMLYTKWRPLAPAFDARASGVFIPPSPRASLIAMASPRGGGPVNLAALGIGGTQPQASPIAVGSGAAGARLLTTASAASATRDLITTDFTVRASSTASESDEYVVVYTPQLAVSLTSGRFEAKAGGAPASSMSATHASTKSRVRRTGRATKSGVGSGGGSGAVRDVVHSGQVTFAPPKSQSEAAQYSVHQGFVLFASVVDKHYSAIAVTGQKNPGLQILPKSELAFPRVLIDQREVDYLIIRNLMGIEANWSLRFRGNPISAAAAVNTSGAVPPSPMAAGVGVSLHAVPTAAGSGGAASAGFSAFQIMQRAGVLQPNQTVVVQIVFEPNAQGTYREVLEVVLTDAVAGGGAGRIPSTPSAAGGTSSGGASASTSTVVAKLALSGIGHQPRIVGFPTSLDFGSVPVGFFAYQWIDLRNDGFVDDVVHIYSQKPFLTSHLSFQIRAKARRRVCFFFRPTRTAAVVLRSFSILAGGKVIRIPCKGSGGEIRMAVKHDIKSSPIIVGDQHSGGGDDSTHAAAHSAVSAAVSAFNPKHRPSAANALALLKASPIAVADTERIGLGACLVDSLLTADLLLVNEGTLSIRVAPLQQIVMPKGVTLTPIQVILSNKKLSSSASSSGVSVSASSSGSSASWGALRLARGALASAQNASQFSAATDHAAVLAWSGAAAAAAAASKTGDETPTASGAAKPLVLSAKHSINVPPYHSLRVRVQFTLREQKPFAFPFTFQYSEMQLDDSSAGDSKAAAPASGFSFAGKSSSTAILVGALNSGRVDAEPLAPVRYVSLSALDRETNQYMNFLDQRSRMLSVVDEFSAAGKQAAARAAAGTVPGGDSDEPAATLNIGASAGVMRASRPDTSEGKGPAPTLVVPVTATSSGAVPPTPSGALRAPQYANDEHWIDAQLTKFAVPERTPCVTRELSVALYGTCHGGISINPPQLDFGAVPASRYLVGSGAGSGAPLPPPAVKSLSDSKKPSASASAVVPATAQAAASSGRQTVHQYLRVYNASYQMQQLRLVSVAPAAFVILKSEYEIAPQQTVDIAVYFYPHDSNQMYIGKAIFTHLLGTVAIPLRGIGAAADLQVIPSASVDTNPKLSVIKFPSVKLHQLSSTRVMVRNSGLLSARYAVKVNHVAFRLIDPASPAQQESTEITGALPSGSVITLTVTCLLFNEQREQNAGTLSLSWEQVPFGLWQTRTFALDARVGQPKLAIEHTIVHFGRVVLNRLAVRKVTIRNTGDAKLEWSTDSTPIAGAGANGSAGGAGGGGGGGATVVLDTGGVSCVPARGAIRPGGSKLIRLLYRPSDIQELNTRFSIHSDGGTIPIVCTGMAVVPQLVVGELSSEFGIVRCGRRLTHSFEIWNSSAQPIDYRVGIDSSPVFVLPQPPLEVRLRKRRGPSVDAMNRIPALENGGSGHSSFDAGDGGSNNGSMDLSGPAFAPTIQRLQEIVDDDKPIVPARGTVRRGGGGDEKQQSFIDERKVPDNYSRPVAVLLKQPSVPQLPPVSGGRQPSPQASSPSPRAAAGGATTSSGRPMLRLTGSGGALPAATVVDDPFTDPRFLDSLDPQEYDLQRRRDEAAALLQRASTGATSGGMSPAEPFQYAAFSVFPWCGRIPPFGSVRVELFVQPNELAKLYEARLVVAHGTIESSATTVSAATTAPASGAAATATSKGSLLDVKHQRTASTISVAPVTALVPQIPIFHTLELQVGVIRCIGGGARLTLHVAIDTAKHASWQADLGIDPKQVFLPGVVPLGLVADNQLTVDTQTLTLRNSGNMNAFLLVRPRRVAAGVTELLRRTQQQQLEAAVNQFKERELQLSERQSQLARGLNQSADRKAGDDDSAAAAAVYDIRPAQYSLQPDESLPLAIHMHPNKLGFIQSEYEIVSAEANFNENFTLLLYSGDTRLHFVASSVDFGRCQIGRLHSRSVTLRNSGNRSVTFTATIRSVGHSLPSPSPSNGSLSSLLASKGFAPDCPFRLVLTTRNANANTTSSTVIHSSSAVPELVAVASAPQAQLQQTATPITASAVTTKIDPYGELTLEVQYLPVQIHDESVTGAQAASGGRRAGGGGAGGFGELKDFVPNTPRVDSPSRMVHSPDGDQPVIDTTAGTDAPEAVPLDPFNRAELRIEWLGPSFGVPVNGAGGTAGVEIEYPPPPVSSVVTTAAAPLPNTLDFGRCMIDYVHWRTVTLRNTGTLPLEYRLSSSEEWIRFVSAVQPVVAVSAVATQSQHPGMTDDALELSRAANASSSGGNAASSAAGGGGAPSDRDRAFSSVQYQSDSVMYVAPHSSSQVWIGVLPTAASETVHGVVTVQSSVGEYPVRVRVTGGRFSCALSVPDVSFGEIAAGAVQVRSVTITNTGQLDCILHVSMQPPRLRKLFALRPVLPELPAAPVAPVAPPLLSIQVDEDADADGDDDKEDEKEEDDASGDDLPQIDAGADDDFDSRANGDYKQNLTVRGTSAGAAAAEARRQARRNARAQQKAARREERKRLAAEKRAAKQAQLAAQQQALVAARDEQIRREAAEKELQAKAAASSGECRISLAAGQSMEVRIELISSDEIEVACQMAIVPVAITGFKPLLLPVTASIRLLQLVLEVPPPVASASTTADSVVDSAPPVISPESGLGNRLAPLLAPFGAGGGSSTGGGPILNAFDAAREQEAKWSIDVGRVILGQTTSITRIIHNPATASTLDFAISMSAAVDELKHQTGADTAAADDALRHWSVSPTSGTVGPLERVPITITYTSTDANSANWHAVRFQLLNQTRGSTDARWTARGSVAFPKLVLSPVRGGAGAMFPFGCRAVGQTHYRLITLTNEGTGSIEFTMQCTDLVYVSTASVNATGPAPPPVSGGRPMPLTASLARADSNASSTTFFAVSRADKRVAVRRGLVHAGRPVSFWLAFRPVVTGAACQAVFTVHSLAGEQSVLVYGLASDFAVDNNSPPKEIDFGTVFAGEPVERMFSVANLAPHQNSAVFSFDVKLLERVAWHVQNVMSRQRTPQHVQQLVALKEYVRATASAEAAAAAAHAALVAAALAQDDPENALHPIDTGDGDHKSGPAPPHAMAASTPAAAEKKVPVVPAPHRMHPSTENLSLLLRVARMKPLRDTAWAEAEEEEDEQRLEAFEKKRAEEARKRKMAALIADTDDVPVVDTEGKLSVVTVVPRKTRTASSTGGAAGADDKEKDELDEPPSAKRTGSMLGAGGGAGGRDRDDPSILFEGDERDGDGDEDDENAPAAEDRDEEEERKERERAEAEKKREAETIRGDCFVVYPQCAVLAERTNFPVMLSPSTSSGSIVSTAAAAAAAANSAPTSGAALTPQELALADISNRQLALLQTLQSITGTGPGATVAAGVPSAVDTKVAKSKPAATAATGAAPLPSSVDFRVSFRAPLQVLFDGSASVASLHAAKKRSYEQTLYVYLIGSGIRKVTLRAVVSLHPIKCSRTELNFWRTLTNTAVTRLMNLTNPASYNVPFEITTTHPAFTCSPSTGLVERELTIVVRFFSETALDTTSVSKASARPALLIRFFDNSLLPPLRIPLAAVCTDYIFDTKLLHDIDFGCVLIANRVTHKIVLRNVTDADVHYRLRLESDITHAAVPALHALPPPGDGTDSYSLNPSSDPTVLAARATASGAGGASDTPIFIRTADAENIIRYGEQREVTIAFESAVPRHVMTKLDIETKAGVYPMKITAIAALPTIECEPRKIDFGVVAIGSRVVRTVTLRNTSELLLHLFGSVRGKKTGVKDTRTGPGSKSDEKSVVPYSTYSGARSQDPALRSESRTSAGSGVAADGSIEPIVVPSSVDVQVVSWGPYTIHVPAADLKPNATTTIQIYYTPTEWTPARGGTTAIDEGEEAVPAAPAAKPAVAAKKSAAPVPALSVSTSEIKSPRMTAVAAPPESPRTHSRSDSRLAAAPPLSDAEKKKEDALLERVWSASGSGRRLELFNTAAGDSTAAALKLADRLRLGVLHRGWADLLSQISCIGQPGHLRLVFSTTNLKLGNIPKLTRRTGEITIRNEGDVPVQLSIAAKDSDLRGTTLSYAIPGHAAPSSTLATLAINIIPPQSAPFQLYPGQNNAPNAMGGGGSAAGTRTHSRSQSIGGGTTLQQLANQSTRPGSRQSSASRGGGGGGGGGGASSAFGFASSTSTCIPFMVRPGETATLEVTVAVRRRGPVNFPFTVLLLGVVPPQAWEFTVTGYADELMLPADLARVVTSEVLPLQVPIECPENAHLLQVLKPIDAIPAVSIRHELACVEPAVNSNAAASSLDHKTAIPSPLTTNVLKTFKKWYHTRLPLRMTDRKDDWRRLQPMLDPIEQYVDVDDPKMAPF